MNAKKLIQRLGFLIPLVAVLLALTACPPPEQPTSDKPAKPTKPAKGVGLSSHANLEYLDYDDDCAAESAACVDTPDQISIWKANGKNSGKPKKATWWIPKAQEDLYYWEITYKGPVGKDYLGPIDPIKCNRKKTTTAKIVGNVDPGADLEWLYQVTVYGCKDNEKDPNDCKCKSDPKIEIHD